jgi:hypothetical protein
MSASVLYGLVLFSAVAHAIWNSLVKSAGDRVLTMVTIRFTGLVLGLAALPFVDWPLGRPVGYIAFHERVLDYRQRNVIEVALLQRSPGGTLSDLVGWRPAMYKEFRDKEDGVIKGRAMARPIIRAVAPCFSSSRTGSVVSDRC